MSEQDEYHKHCRNTIEAALMVARRPLNIRQLKKLFRDDQETMDKEQVLALLEEIREEYDQRGMELVKLASGWQLQVGPRYSDRIMNMLQEKPPRLSRALLETLAIIAYRQPVTRGEIEDIRGVQISQGTIHTLFERGWIHTVGHRDTPGRPELLATTRAFLDYFQLQRLEDLPPVATMGESDYDQATDLFANATEIEQEATSPTDREDDKNPDADDSGDEMLDTDDSGDEMLDADDSGDESIDTDSSYDKLDADSSDDSDNMTDSDPDSDDDSYDDSYDDSDDMADSDDDSDDMADSDPASGEATTPVN